MTVPITDTAPRIQYTVGGVATTAFTVPFEFYDAADLNVYVGSVLKTLTSEYSVSGGSGAPGAIALSVAVTNTTVTIIRDIPIMRGSDFPLTGPFNISSLNTDLNKHTAIMQQQESAASRSVKLPDTDPDGTMILPDLATRSSNYFAFDSDGDPIASAGSAGTPGVVVSSYMATVLDDTTAAAARTTLGVEAASTTAAGIVELANELETAVGTDTTRAVTPNSLRGKLPWGATPGTADAIAVTYSPALTGLPDGQLCFFRAAAANTSTTPTFNPNGLGALPIVKNGNQPLVAGDIAGQYHEIMLRYEATNTRWELLNPAVPAAAVAGRVKLVDNDWSTGTPSSVTFEDADGMDWSTYSYFEIELQGYISATCRLLCTFSQSGAYETGGTDYFYANTGQQFSASFHNGTVAINIPNVSNQIYKGGSQYNEMFHMRATLYPGLSDGTNIGGPYIHWSFVSSVSGTGNRGHANGTGALRNLVATEIDGIKFEQNTGNMPNGSFKVWGII